MSPIIFLELSATLSFDARREQPRFRPCTTITMLGSLRNTVLHAVERRSQSTNARPAGPGGVSLR